MQKFAIGLGIVGLADAISYMIVAPSIIFYVLEKGGNNSQYGIILSSFSFASFCTKPFLGGWTDNHGFRPPYFLSLSIAMVGGLVYFLASAFPNGMVAVSLIFLARLLSGVGAASSTLGFAYIARMLPSEQQTQFNSLLSMIRIFGMAAGPGVNVFLSEIDFNIGIFEVNHLNSVGLILILVNLGAIIAIYYTLDEPPESDDHSDNHEHNGDDSSMMVTLKALFSPDIFVYVISIFSFNAAFQLIETAFAPAAKHALGWGPVETSTVFGAISVIIFFGMLIVFKLSAAKVGDEYLLSYGLVHGGIGYLLIYFLWTDDSNALLFALPILLGASSFPFLGAPTRSLFTKIVDSKPSLDSHHGKMQAMLSMGASVAGFVSPSLIATFVLRHPDDVEASKDGRELTPLAFFAPVLYLITLIGHIYVQYQIKKQKSTKSQNDEEKSLNVEINENTALTGKKRSTKLHKRKYNPRFAMYRQSSSTIMGVSQPHHHAEDAEPEND